MISPQNRLHQAHHRSCMPVPLDLSRGFSGIPRAVVLPGLTRDMMVTSSADTQMNAGIYSPSAKSSDATLVALNTCTSDALAELLRHLKRAYWPMPWDTSPGASPRSSSSRDDAEGRDHDSAMSHGGFRPAAKAACGDEMSAQLRALTTVANHRLERGM